MQTLTQETVSKLTTLLDVRYIYKSDIAFKDCDTSLIIVILEGNCSSLTQELSSMVAKIFQEETDFLYRIFSFEYARQQLKENNLFFIHGCSPAKLIYKSSGAESQLIDQTIDANALNNIAGVFKKEVHKISAFMDGANFFLERENLSQAAFMLHQYIELWFRYAGLLIMGKERKSHSIKELKTYIKVFAPGLGTLFNTELEEEQNLLKLLDEAYITTRYHNNYHINKEQINIILEKANKVEAIVTALFKDRLSACTNQESNQSHSPIATNAPEKQPFATNEKKILNLFKSLSGKDFSALTPYRFKEGLYTTGIVTKGYLGTSFMISNLIKVCILAMDSSCYSTRLIPEPEHNIREVLGYIIDIIPHDEMELLDVIRDLVLEPETNH
ncbi:HEPN domain-containing protein [Galbibacter sp. EGI 63066]|uniref:HEPN domain-containing protein n=1 Tax=Galbibacter sp. EGI 63066 TaxID=2993559 RepID=UPI0022491DD6|nr:HEPN domain-containing protein [Galbibacter sp. EGI 63066]MCX2681402.1 HEPN domain-containing protein [Galbibacter sp. EGI 63066]